MNTQSALETVRQNPQAAQRAQEQLQGLLSRSATDPRFRERLLEDPRGAVAEFTGQPVSESLNVVFVENTADATIVLPDPIDPAAELSDAELEGVAGGVITAGAIAVALFCAFVAGATSAD